MFGLKKKRKKAVFARTRLFSGAKRFPKLIEDEPKVTGVTTQHRVSMR